MEKTMSYDEARVLVLKKETVEVKPIIRDKAFFKKGHDGEFMFTGTVKTYQLPFSNSTRAYVKIFDDEKEQAAFEKLLDKETGSLNIYNRDNEFWLKFKVELTKEGKVLDLSIPSHALEHKVLLANSHRIAPNWGARHKPGLEFALVNETQIREDDNVRANLSEKAMELFFKIKGSNSKMFNVLRLLEKMPPKDVSGNTGFLKTEILKVIDQKEITRNSAQKSIHDFVKVMEDKKFETKILIYDAMDANEIVIKNSTFRIVATDSVMGTSLEQAADWIDNLQNQEEKILLQQRLEKK